MTLTDLDCADLCIELYGGTRGFDLYWPESLWGLTAALKVWGNRDVIVHRGSVTPHDWYDDLISEGAEYDPNLGPVPAGFYQGTRAFHEATKNVVRAGSVLTGHSLGAARAVIHGAFLAAAGNPPIAIIVFGCPRPGTPTMNALFAQTNVRWYRNRTDPVTQVPVPIPAMLPWIHCGAETRLNEEPAANDVWAALADHHIELYRAGVAALSPMPQVA